MAQITLIDDDRTEALVLQGMLDHVEGQHDLTHITRVEAFDAQADAPGPELLLLDRRLPPHEAFDTSLPVIAASGYRGPVVLLSASAISMPDNRHGLAIMETICKSELLTPLAVEALLKRSLRDV